MVTTRPARTSCNSRSMTTAASGVYSFMGFVTKLREPHVRPTEVGPVGPPDHHPVSSCHLRAPRGNRCSRCPTHGCGGAGPRARSRSPGRPRRCRRQSSVRSVVITSPVGDQFLPIRYVVTQLLGEALKIPPDANEPDGHSQNEDGFDPGYLTGYQASSGRAYRKQNLFGTDSDFGYLEPKAHQGAAASAGRVEPTPAAVPTSSPSSCLPERTPGDHGRG